MPTPLYLQLGEIMRGPKVRAALDAVGAKIEAGAKSGVDAADQGEVVRTSGTRPGTHAKDNAARPYSRVSVPLDWEYGSPSQERLRVLGRAVAGL